LNQAQHYETKAHPGRDTKVTESTVEPSATTTQPSAKARPRSEVRHRSRLELLRGRRLQSDPWKSRQCDTRRSHRTGVMPQIGAARSAPERPFWVYGLNGRSRSGVERTLPGLRRCHRADGDGLDQANGRRQTRVQDSVDLQCGGPCVVAMGRSPRIFAPARRLALRTAHLAPAAALEVPNLERGTRAVRGHFARPLPSVDSLPSFVAISSKGRPPPAGASTRPWLRHRRFC
jgi:hypothetical protein